MTTIPNCIMVEMLFITPVKTAEITFHVKTAGVPTFADCTAVRTVFDNWHLNTLRASMASPYLLSAIYTKSLAGPGSPFEEYILPVARAGSGAASTTPIPQLAICVKLNTGLSGRSYRGRVYLMGINTAAAISNGTWGLGLPADIAGRFLTLKNSLTAAGYTLGVASKYSGVDANGRPIPRVVGFITPVTTITSDNRQDTQRRRLPKVGA